MLFKNQNNDNGRSCDTKKKLTQGSNVTQTETSNKELHVLPKIKN